MSAMDPDRPPPSFDALHVPPAVLEQGGFELLRAVIVDGSLHVSLRRAFDEPEVWGALLADVARHIGRIYAKETALSEDQAFERAIAIFQAEIGAPTDPGTTSAIG